VVEFALRSSLVSEVIVIDDGSIDGTPELAQAAGARVVTSTLLGKGVSMEDGIREAQNEVIVYLDGDLRGLREDLIERMAASLLSGEADFVKARFTRAAGRVTILTARPLLRTYFPEIAHFEQPLSGVIAARRSLLEKLRFENDYGVDVGLFIDALMAKARLAEVDIGHLEHQSHPLEVLGEMATQVARTILDRAGRFGRLRTSFVRNVKENELHNRSDLASIFEGVPRSDWIALFDMDGTLLKGRFIVELAARAGRSAELEPLLDNRKIPAELRSQKIAALLTGVPQELFEATARELPLMPGAIETVVGLRKLGFRVGIVTDSYQIPADIVRRRVFADFSFGNLIRFKNGKATGRLTPCPAMEHPDGCPEHSHCKFNVLRHLIERVGVRAENVVAVGDGENDMCLLRAVGRSIAFEPKTFRVGRAAQHVVHGTLSAVLSIVQMPIDGCLWITEKLLDPLKLTPDDDSECASPEPVN
jgi:HAD superfamily phosphoserine phosphatase-like hydrolase